MSDRTYKSVPTDALERFRANADSQLVDWRMAEKDLTKRLESAKRMIKSHEAQKELIEKELLYRREHPEGV